MKNFFASEARYSSIVILANGSFPKHVLPLQLLRDAKKIICCDGAARSLLRFGRQPDAIVGDGDSLSKNFKSKYNHLLHIDKNQDDNDLAKAFRFCMFNNWRNLTILGATGLRDDHALGNIGWLADFVAEANIAMFTDQGCFTPLAKSGVLATLPGQPVSIFSFDNATEISSKGLQYPLKNLKLTRWWQATLNIATGKRVSLNFSGGPILVFRAYFQPGICL